MRKSSFRQVKAALSLYLHATIRIPDVYGQISDACAPLFRKGVQMLDSFGIRILKREWRTGACSRSMSSVFMPVNANSVILSHICNRQGISHVLFPFPVRQSLYAEIPMKPCGFVGIFFRKKQYYYYFPLCLRPTGHILSLRRSLGRHPAGFAGASVA